jgi:Cu+-exporting ATPase
MRLLGRRQIFLKNPHVVESLAKVDHVVFDKTGTLTAPGAAAVEFHGAPLSETEERWLYSMTRHSTHPLPVRIGEVIAGQHFPEPVGSFLETAGCGMEGRVAGQEIWMGSAGWLASRNAAPPVQDVPDGSAVHVAINGRYRGTYTLSPVLRPEVHKLVANLSPKYKLGLLSGDTGRDRARFEGIFRKEASLRFNQSPRDKLEFIQEAQQSGQTVMMVGDGLNDGAALRQADIGVAVVENIGAFSPASDVIVEAGNVPRLASILAFARDSVRVVWFSIGISLVYNLVGIGIAATGRLSPLVCAVLMPLSSISVVAFAVGATHWMARRAGLSSPNPNLVPQPAAVLQEQSKRTKIDTEVLA